MYFQSLDDKSECVGIYSDGNLYFNSTPENLKRTWKYSGSIKDPSVEYAWLYCGGKTLKQACPTSLKPELERSQKKFQAYLNSFKISKIDLNENCFFDLVPKTFLMEFCEIKNKITKHVFQTHKKPANYQFLNSVQKLLHRIRYRELNLNRDDCVSLYYSALGS